VTGYYAHRPGRADPTDPAMLIDRPAPSRPIGRLILDWVAKNQSRSECLRRWPEPFDGSPLYETQRPMRERHTRLRATLIFDFGRQEGAHLRLEKSASLV